jgi:hypothetical protein
VSLSTLRPTQPTDLVQLSEFLRRKKGRRGALPASLTEPMLLSIARDLRSLEEGNDAEPVPSIAAPMMLVICLVLGTARPGAKKDEMTVSESALWDLMRVYQWAVEREIVTRITGIGGDDEESLLEQLAIAARH